jgi:ketopantoate reductase
MQSIGCNATADGNEVARNSDVIILATKPDGVGKALTDAKAVVTKEKLIISICAGVNVAKKLCIPGIPGIPREAVMCARACTIPAMFSHSQRASTPIRNVSCTP